MIDEKKLLKEINGMWKEDDFLPVERFVEVIEHQPKIGGWIPCSERLPEEPKENPILDYKPLELYLVSVEGADYAFRAFWNGEFFSDGFSKLKNVIAWQPLPETYKE